MFGAVGGLNTGEAAIMLARALAVDARVVLVGLNSQNAEFKSIADDPSASGLAELAAGTASFRDVIGKDTSSGVHVILAGRSPAPRWRLVSSARLATAFVALEQSYDYVVFDAGIADGAELNEIAGVAPQALLLTEDIADPATAAVRERLVAAGFGEVTPLESAPVGRRAAA